MVAVPESPLGFMETELAAGFPTLLKQCSIPVMKTPLSLVPALLLGSLILAFPSCAADSGLRERLADAHAIGADHWIYNDLDKAGL